MKISRHGVSLVGIVILLTLVFTSLVSAQPAMQYLNIPGIAFQSNISTFTYAHYGACINATGGITASTAFQFPVLLPRGSIIKYLEFFYYDSTAAITTLSLRKYNPNANTYTGLKSLSTETDTGYATRISEELNISVETDCSTDPQCFYMLNWHTLTPNNTQRLCGARIHYIPPFGALALPVIQRN